MTGGYAWPEVRPEARPEVWPEVWPEVRQEEEGPPQAAVSAGARASTLACVLPARAALCMLAGLLKKQYSPCLSSRRRPRAAACAQGSLYGVAARSAGVDSGEGAVAACSADDAVAAPAVGAVAAPGADVRSPSGADVGADVGADMGVPSGAACANDAVAVPAVDAVAAPGVACVGGAVAVCVVAASSRQITSPWRIRRDAAAGRPLTSTRPLSMQRLRPRTPRWGKRASSAWSSRWPACCSTRNSRMRPSVSGLAQFRSGPF